MMTPAERARDLCQRAGDNFAEVLEAHLLLGVVFSTPQLFVAARCVPRRSSISLWEAFPAALCDAWFIWIGVGDARELLRMMPHRLPWVGFARIGRKWSDNHFVSTDALQWRLRKTRRGRVSTCNAPGN